MSFGLGKGRVLDDAPGRVGVTREELGPLPDDLRADPRAAWTDPRAWFPAPSRPLEVEIGSGKGTFLIQQAAEQPDTNFLGIEWAREFYLYTADRVRRRGLLNVRVLHADASEFLRWRMPDGIVRVVHVYFPDPWPKSRHHKNRLIQARFLGDCWRVLAPAAADQPAGEVRIVTDHDDYWSWIQARIEEWAAGGEQVVQTGRWFESRPLAPAAAGGEELVGSNFERKYRREGRPFHAVVLRKAGG